MKKVQLIVFITCIILILYLTSTRSDERSISTVIIEEDFYLEL